MTADEIGREIERLAVERRMAYLEAQVKRLPTYDEDGNWVKAQVLQLIKEVTTPAVADRTAGLSLRTSGSHLSAASVAAAGHENARAG